MAHKDPMGDRLKVFEKFGTEHRATPQLPMCVRLDGRAFHTYTKNMDRPFDERMTAAMDAATKKLVSEFKPRIAYTQSDEITLIFHAEWVDKKKEPPELPFSGKFHKLNSVFASTAAVAFYQAIVAQMPEKEGIVPAFDCRCWSVPSRIEAANTVLWRWFDAKKNSISMLARAHFSHKKLYRLTTKEMCELLLDTNVDWNDIPPRHKWGAFFRRENVMRELTEEELAKIPEKHRPTGPVVRTIVKEIEVPPLDQVDSGSRIGFIFDGKRPMTDEDWNDYERDK